MSSGGTDEVIDRFRAGVATASPEETQALAAALAPRLPAGAVLALHGDLGAGKTTFVQGLARGFGVTEAVRSPTFTVFTLHRGTDRLLVHVDAYRLTTGDQLHALMIDDFLVPPHCVAVEWPENVASWLPRDTWHLHLSIVKGRRHSVRLVP